MCLLVGVVWVVLLGVVILMGVANVDEKIIAIAAISSVGIGILAPIIISYWKPLFFRWASKNKTLQKTLLSQGVLTQSDLEQGARAVRVVEVNPDTEKELRKTRQDAFVLLEGNTLRILGVHWCAASESFSIRKECFGQCSKCLVIWACGGDPFVITATVEGQPKMYHIWLREGRSLRQAAKFGEMLKEHLLSQAPETEDSADTPSDAQAPENDAPPEKESCCAES